MESSSEIHFTLSTIAAIVFTLIFFFYTKSTKTSSYPLIGNIIAFLLNLHRFHDWVTDLLSNSPTNTIQVNTFLKYGICTANPANIQHLLRSNFSNYIKGSRIHHFFHDLLGNGIFIVDSDLWFSQRKISSLEFNTRSLRLFIDQTVQSEISSRLLPHLSNVCNRVEETDFQEVFQRFAFNNMCKLAFGLDSDLDSSFVTAFDEAVEICASRAMSPIHLIWKMKRFLNIGSEKRLKEAIKQINEYSMKIIRSREESITNRQDLLSRFMLLEPDPKFLRDIITSFVLAGKDTTSTALTWFFWILSANSDIQNRINTELTQLKIRSGVFTYEDLKPLNYLHAAISESLRLFPPVPMNTRLTVKDDVLPDGTKVKAGWFADYSAYAVGRMESVWGEDCREFRPERWFDEEGVFRPVDQFRFPVFHGGPRVCLGREMAYMQMKSVAAAVIFRFEIEAVDGGGDVEKMKNPPYVLSVVLKMRGGLHVRLRSRNNSEG